MNIERINDPDIQRLFDTIVEELTDLYKVEGGGDTLFIFSDKDHRYKMFINDIKDIHEPHIVIRKS